MTKYNSIFVTYSQIAVFQTNLENPFNDWTDKHVLQGFSWRSNSVSFHTLDEDGEMRVKFQINNSFKKINKDTIRAIRVPFETNSGLLEVASISDGINVEIPSGKYSLYFETGKDNQGMWCIFTLSKYEPEPLILLCDHELRPQYPLLMETMPA